MSDSTEILDRIKHVESAMADKWAVYLIVIISMSMHAWSYTEYQSLQRNKLSRAKFEKFADRRRSGDLMSSQKLSKIEQRLATIEAILGELRDR